MEVRRILAIMAMILIEVLALPEFETSIGRRLYSGYQVLRSFPSSSAQRSALLRLDESVDFWSDVGPETRMVDIMVEPGQVARVANYLVSSGISFQVMISDLQADIEAENINEDNFNSTVALPAVRRDKRQNTKPVRRQKIRQFTQNLRTRNHQFGLPGFKLSFITSPRRPKRKPQSSLVQTTTRQTRRPKSQISVPAINSPSTSFSSSTQSTSSSSIPSGIPPCKWTGMSWSQYQSYKTISDWMNCIVANYPTKAKLINIGKSSEGRPLQVLKIGNGTPGKPAVFIDGGIHAREWVSPAAVTYLIHRMVETEGEYTMELDTFDVYILPLANPDGYEYSRNHDRMWRKTRSRTGAKNLFGQACHGVDPNRNFGFRWGGYGASDNACKETFRGSKAFSEPETRAMRDFLLNEAADFKLYLTFHSYGQYILYPWGYDKLDTRDWKDLLHVGNTAGRALKQINGVEYQIGSAAKMLYPASGGSDDWAKGGAGIKFSYTVELPDTGRHGFILPARFIKNVGFQATTVIKSMFGAVRETLPK